MDGGGVLAAAIPAATIPMPIPIATAVAAAAVAVTIRPRICVAVVLFAATASVVAVQAGAICRAGGSAKAAARCIPAWTKSCVDCC